MSDTDILFEAILVPHRSLPPLGFFVVMAALVGVSLAIGIGFSVAGAWPVLGFLGIDIILVYIAFRISYGAARQSEHVRLSAQELEIVLADPSGTEKRTVLQAYWAKIDVEPENAKRVRLVIRSHGRTLELGSFLGTAEKLAFAEAPSNALRDARDTAAEAHRH